MDVVADVDAGGQPPKLLSVPGVQPSVAVWAFGGGSLLRLAALGALFCRVGLAAHYTPDGELTPYSDMVEAVALLGLTRHLQHI